MLEFLVLFLVMLNLCWVIDLQGRLLPRLRRQEFILAQILESLKSVGAAQEVQFFTIIDGKKQKVEEMILKDSQNLPLTVSFVDAKGNAASVQGAPAWSVSDASLATLQVADDGMSALVMPVGPLGSLKVQASADADLGDGVNTIVGEMDIDIVGGDAVTVQLAAGTPVDAATPAPAQPLSAAKA